MTGMGRISITCSSNASPQGDHGNCKHGLLGGEDFNLDTGNKEGLDTQLRKVRSESEVNLVPPQEAQLISCFNITNVGMIGSVELGTIAPPPSYIVLLGVCMIYIRKAHS
jgi:hypothetical protein